MVNIRLWRDYPAEGWPSMDRYATSLYHAFIKEALAADIDMLEPPAPWPGRYGVIASRYLRYPGWMRRNHGDINHILDHSYAHLCRSGRGKTLVTVHDLAPMAYSRRLSVSGMTWRLSVQGIKRADLVITDSTFIADELTRVLGIPLTRITVIPLGVSGACKPLAPSARLKLRVTYNLGAGPLALHIGNWQSRKNPIGILTALKELQRRNVIVQLVQAGATPSREILQKIREWDLLDQVLFMGHVTEDELVELYNTADLLLFPSLYEGFGLPVLEAMACGTPVVTSDISSLPEVAGEAAVLVDPLDAKAIANGIERVLDDHVLRVRLIEIGLERAKAFSWENTAHQVFRQYETLMH
ncbi:MAG: glycosyltransferase family 4 protein [Chloroflexi bacterium]|nr:glycosyltransferase family 4 protein [Chloroflexota bacterium]